MLPIIFVTEEVQKRFSVLKECGTLQVLESVELEKRYQNRYCGIVER